MDLEDNLVQDRKTKVIRRQDTIISSSMKSQITKKKTRKARKTTPDGDLPFGRTARRPRVKGDGDSWYQT